MKKAASERKRKRKRQEFPMLVEGETVECLDSGKRYRVGRVTVCSASLHEVYRAPKEVTLTTSDPKTGEAVSRTFLATQGSGVVQVSARACFKRIKGTDAE